MYVYGAASHSPSPAGMVMVFPPFEVVDSFFLSLPSPGLWWWFVAVFFPPLMGGGHQHVTRQHIYIYKCIYACILHTHIYEYRMFVKQQ